MVHRCSICGADWFGHHQCDPVQRSAWEATKPIDIRSIRQAERNELAILRDQLAVWVSAAERLLTEKEAAEAKLAALVKAAEPFACDQGCDAVHHPAKDRHDQRDNCPVVARLRSALAAAKSKPHSADPSSAAPPVGNPATPPSGR